MKSFAPWFARVQADWSKIGELADGLDGTRSAIFGLWGLMSDAPPSVCDLHRGLNEQGLAEEALATGLDELPALPSVTAEGNGPERLWRVMATTLRSLELRWVALSDGSTIRRGSQCRAAFDNRSGYLIPIPARHRPPKTGDSFRRRGLARTRVLPDELGQFRLDVCFTEDPFPRPKDQKLSMAAGLFAGLELDIVTVDEGFRVRGASAPGQGASIAAGLTKADEEDCFAMVFPELCIDGAMLDATAALLGGGSLDLERVGIILAGSRHEQLNGSFYNLSTVLDRYGKSVGEHRKMFRYSDVGGPHEAISLGDTISVIVVGEIVVAIGICLDFCNASVESAYPFIDVDYVLVPSCGGLTTMRAHVERSGQILTSMKTRTFVVQQHHDEKDGSLEHFAATHTHILS